MTELQTPSPSVLRFIAALSMGEDISTIAFSDYARDRAVEQGFVTRKREGNIELYYLTDIGRAVLYS